MGIIVNGFSFLTNRNRGIRFGSSASYARARFTHISHCSSLPQGCRPPHSFIIAQKCGDLASVNNIDVTSSEAANLAGGFYIDSDIDGSIQITGADLGLIASMLSVIDGSGYFTSLPILAGVLSGVSNITATSLTSAQLGAISDSIAVLVASGILSVNAGCSTASLSADITPFTTLSPESLAKAVWEYLSQNPKQGSTLQELKKKLGKIDFIALK